VNRWTLRWCEHSTGGRLDDGNLAGEDTQALSMGELGEDSPDRWAPSVSDSGTVMGGRSAHARRWAGVGAELGRLQRKRPTLIFSILNHFPIE
jgi:hypothetical protein